MWSKTRCPQRLSGSARGIPRPARIVNIGYGVDHATPSFGAARDGTWSVSSATRLIEIPGTRLRLHHLPQRRGQACTIDASSARRTGDLLTADTFDQDSWIRCAQRISNAGARPRPTAHRPAVIRASKLDRGPRLRPAQLLSPCGSGRQLTMTSRIVPIAGLRSPRIISTCFPRGVADLREVPRAPASDRFAAVVVISVCSVVHGEFVVSRGRCG